MITFETPPEESFFVLPEGDDFSHSILPPKLLSLASLGLDIVLRRETTDHPLHHRWSATNGDDILGYVEFDIRHTVPRPEWQPYI